LSIPKRLSEKSLSLFGIELENHAGEKAKTRAATNFTNGFYLRENQGDLNAQSHP